MITVIIEDNKRMGEQNKEKEMGTVRRKQQYNASYGYINQKIISKKTMYFANIN